MTRSKYKTSTQKRKPVRPGSGGKVDNDHNRQGAAPPTQLHQGQRTPQSRDDRQAKLGAGNQSQSRKGASKGRQGLGQGQSQSQIH
jgi:hypothetical protein